MKLNEELFIEAQHVLEPEDAAIYDASFNEQNWWGNPDNPAIGLVAPLQASKLGKSLLNLYPVFNDGMLRLGDPTQPETPLQADAHPRGTIVKTIFERLEYSHGLERMSDERLTTASDTSDGYMITRYFGKNFAAYSQYVTWWASAEAKQGGLAFFPLTVDSAASYAAGLTDRYSPAIKITGALPRYGLKSITPDRVQASRNRVTQNYLRIGSVAIYKPLESPRGKWWTPTALKLQ